MKNLGLLLLAIAVAVVSWGVYGPTLQQGNAGMEGSSLRPFICVGIAYFLIAVLTPAIALRMFGEAGHWSAAGILWSLAAGAAGAVGALGVILALAFHGSPLYVMPLVFGGAPVVNTFLTMYWSKSFKLVSPVFIAGLILVIVGAVTVLVFRPATHRPAAAAHAAPAAQAAAAVMTDAKAAKPPLAGAEHHWLYVTLFTLMTALSWGVYGPTLHRGQTAMAGSRLRPFLCVGLAYFLIAVLVPTLLLARWEEPGQFTFAGSVWSLAGGTAGALGALGIIMAFTFGGKPIFVMPLVFGGAPVVNTFVSVIAAGNYDQLHPMFYAGLIVVAAGAVTVLVFAPKPQADHAPPPAETTPEAASA
jgi:hypothetical protein